MASFGIGANLSTYGGRGRSSALSSYGQDVEQEATAELREAAAQESQRNAKNTQIEAQNKQGNQQLGATIGGLAGGAIAGAQWGSAAGPWGTLIGGVVGAIAGGLFAFLGAVALVVSLALPSTAEAAMTIADSVPISQVELHQILVYDPETGVFTWLAPNRNTRVEAGDRAGFLRPQGYRVIKISRKAYAEHRLAWLYMHGSWPSDEIDHINRKRDDNRFANLRLATRKQNSENRDARAGSASGFRGVSWSGGKWCAVIMHFGQQKMLGSFDDIEQAKAARLKAEQELFTHSTRVT